MIKRIEKKGIIMSVLEIKDLHVEIEGKEILKGVNLTLKTGEIAAIMGPNGTGKSTLSAAIMGNPNYEVTKGEVLFDGVNILELEVDERARMGLFLAMQYPSEIPGISDGYCIARKSPIRARSSTSNSRMFTPSNRTSPLVTS